jgi:hypothetical protein
MIRAMTLRAAALLALAAFGVHEARYLIVPDAHADAGHAYLGAVPVLLALGLALALGHSLSGLGRRRAPDRALSWLACSGALVAIHGSQELAEHVLAGGGPIDAGLLLVVPLSLVFGVAVSLVLHRAERLLGAAAAPGELPRPRVAGVAALMTLASRSAAAPAGIAHNLAGRAPPAFG